MEEEEKRKETNTVTCMHKNVLLTMSQWCRLNEEREEVRDGQVKSAKENMSCKRRSSVDCSSTVPYPIDRP